MGRKLLEQKSRIDPEQRYAPREALELLKDLEGARFDESVEAHVHLNVVPRRADQMGQIVPVEITVYEDRSFTFITKTSPAAFLLKQAAGLDKGSGEPNRMKVGTVSRAQVEEIARTKMPDLNAADIEGAAKIVEGTARSMGITVDG